MHKVNQSTMNVKMGLGLAGIAMVLSSVFKNEIEPVREAAREIQSDVIALVIEKAEASPAAPEVK